MPSLHVGEGAQPAVHRAPSHSRTTPPNAGGEGESTDESDESEDEFPLDGQQLGAAAVAECYHAAADSQRSDSKTRAIEPWRFIVPRVKRVKRRALWRLFLAQEIAPSSHNSGRTATNASGAHAQKSAAKNNAIWTMEFSTCGKYLAAGGQDGVVRIWRIAAFAREQDREKKQPAAANPDSPAGPVPFRSYVGHTADVLSLSWSKNGFLLSASMDRTVRLWHPHRPECLCTFRHRDIVASVAFNPRDDRLFISGSLDCKLRLWDIPARGVKHWTKLPDGQMVTSVAFTGPKGDHIVAGTYRGMCVFYSTDGLTVQGRMHARSSRGRNSKGSKITGFSLGLAPKPADPAGYQLLVSSNDSRLRMFHPQARQLERKYKGHANASSQAFARPSSDGRYIISGSEDHNVYVWSWESLDGKVEEKSIYEYFPAHDAAVSQALFAPASTLQYLATHDDPIL
ncbi:WD40 repeat-like protein, partial [Martensiomyces pterosporus]